MENNQSKVFSRIDGRVYDISNLQRVVEEVLPDFWAIAKEIRRFEHKCYLIHNCEKVTAKMRVYLANRSEKDKKRRKEQHRVSAVKKRRIHKSSFIIIDTGIGERFLPVSTWLYRKYSYRESPEQIVEHFQDERNV